jgi:hypothetical protein
MQEVKDTTKYVVLRNERRTSQDEMTLEEATEELKRWQNIIKRWPDGSKVRIEEVRK